MSICVMSHVISNGTLSIDGFVLASETDYRQCRQLADRLPMLTSPNFAVINLDESYLQDLHLPQEVCLSVCLFVALAFHFSLLLCVFGLFVFVVISRCFIAVSVSIALLAVSLVKLLLFVCFVLLFLILFVVLFVVVLLLSFC